MSDMGHNAHLKNLIPAPFPLPYPLPHSTQGRGATNVWGRSSGQGTVARRLALEVRYGAEAPRSRGRLKAALDEARKVPYAAAQETRKAWGAVRPLVPTTGFG